jgi:cytochrome P450
MVSRGSPPVLPDEVPSFFSPEVASCPHATYRRMVDDHPVTRMPIGNAPVISRYEDVMFCLRHPAIFSSDMAAQMSLGTDRPMIPQQIDPPAQTRYRKILDPRFSRKRMLEIEPALRDSARALLDGFATKGECDFSVQYSVPLPCQAFLHLFGLPISDLPHLIQLKDGIIRPQARAANPLDGEEVDRIRSASGKQIYSYFEDLIALRRKAPRDDLMTYLLEVELEGNKLSQNEILDISYLFILAGLDTVTATLSCCIAYLAANPTQREKISGTPASLEVAIEELLRWETPVTGIPRLVKEDVEIAGYEIEKGELVMLLLGAANIDPAEFEDADRVRLDRSRNRHISFGAGPHRCLGSHLARMELRVGLEEWHRRIPDYAIRKGEVPIYSPGIRDIEHLPLVWS